MPMLLGSHGLAGHHVARAAAHGRRQERARARGGTRHRRRLVWLQHQSQQAATTEEMVRRQIRGLMSLHLLALRLGVDIETIVACLQEEEANGSGAGVWFGAAVPASAAAVAGLEKRTFVHATTEGECSGGTDECAICFEGFEQDGEEVTVMPCSHRHEFHPNCIVKWLKRSNTCPLCRHQLPTGGDDQ
ncbi:unnamed protein product [Urochloa decumbens]|uniref:RING-type domain-containing protein n=1 Tax=Urochloa decumbens TaxID=240449 RepID=A0ABC9AZE3_9POAL